jgi:hypothetical protein
LCAESVQPELGTAPEVAFATQALVKRMTAAGVPEALAEEQVWLVSDRLARKRGLGGYREGTLHLGRMCDLR